MLNPEALSAEIKDIAKALDAVSETYVAKLREHIFVGVFLPFFAGVDNKYNVDLDTWFGVAGGFARPVDVVDNNGNVLFRVPPIMDRTAISPVSGQRSSIMHVVMSAQQYSNISPLDGANYLDNELSQRAMIMQEGNAGQKENTEVWMGIFKRYNIEPVMPEVVENQNSTSVESVTTKDSYDKSADIMGYDAL